MNKYQLWQAIGQIDDEIIKNTIEYEKSKGVEKNIKKNIFINFMVKRAVATMAIICVIAVGVWSVKTYLNNKAIEEKQKIIAEIEQYELVKQKDDSGMMVDMILPSTVEEAIDMSELVVKCTVEKVGEPYYESYVDEKLTEKYLAEGKEEYLYSYIWQDCVLKVENVYSGECEQEISYRYICGDIKAMEGTDKIVNEEGEEVRIASPKGYVLNENDEYILFLSSNEESDVYENAISPWYVRKEAKKITLPEFKYTGDDQVLAAIIEYYREEYLKGYWGREGSRWIPGFVIYDHVKLDDEILVFGVFGQYTYMVDGDVLIEDGGWIPPACFHIKENGTEYEIVEVNEALDGVEYAGSIRAFTEGYPEIYDKIINHNSNEESQKLSDQMQRQFLQMYIEDNNLDIYKYKHNVRDEEKNIFEE